MEDGVAYASGKAVPVYKAHAYSRCEVPHIYAAGIASYGRILLPGLSRRQFSHTEPPSAFHLPLLMRRVPPCYFQY